MVGKVKINFASGKLEKILSNERLIYRYFCVADAKKIMARMSEFDAAENLEQISTNPPPLRHKLIGNKKDQWGVWYSPNDRFVIQPSGCFDINDLRSITEITIIKLGDYH